MASEPRYYLFSVKYSNGSYLVWWRHNAMGYTEWLDEAGTYSKEEADRHCAGFAPAERPTVIPVLVEVARALPRHDVVTITNEHWEAIGAPTWGK